MTGLEKIVSKIAEESAERCAAIIKKANDEATGLIAEAQKKADEKAAEILSKAQLEADRRICVAKSSAESITRTRYLEVRNAIINDIISAAYEETQKMSDGDYFELLYNICVKSVETGECVLYLNERDLKRLPKKFDERINQAVFEKAAVQISKQPRDIEDGFILDYGDFEVNCTVKAIFDDNMEKFKDILSGMLF